MVAKDKLRTKKFQFGFATTSDLNAIGLKNYEITRLCEKGSLERLAQGVYRVKSVKTLDKVELIMKLFPEAVFCFHYYSLDERKWLPNTIHIAVPRNISRSRCREIKGINLIIHTVSEKFHMEDVQTVVLGNKKISCYNCERTTCDIFRYHRHIKNDRWLNDAMCRYVYRYGFDETMLRNYISKFRFDREAKILMDEFLWPKVSRKK